MSRIDTAAVQTAQAGQPDRQQAEAKQRKWLFELEHALLAMGMKKHERAPDRAATEAPTQHRAGAQSGGPMAQQAVPQEGAATVPASPDAGQDMPGLRDHVAEAASSLAGAVASVPPVLAGAAAPEQAVAALSPAGMASAAVAGRAALPHAAPSLHAGVADGAAVPDAGAAGSAGPVASGQAAQSVAGGVTPDTQAMPNAAPADAAPALPVQSGTVPALMAANAASAAQRADLAGGAAEGGVTALQASRPASIGAAALGLGAGPQQEPAAVQQPEPEPVEVPLPQDAAPEQAETEPFEKRLMHLYHGTDGVQAWIRDVELNAAQARALAQTLASELGGNGVRLAALTVNGRKVVASEQDGASAQSMPDALADDNQAGQPETNIIKEI